MIQNPLLLILFLALIEIAILKMGSHPRTEGLFKVLPPIFWIYFTPMLASTAGIIDPGHPLYAEIIHFILPASLVLLLIPVDIKAILRLGRPALLMMLTGTAGIIIATPLAVFLFQAWLPAGAWSGFGALSGSWMGGSSNMIAVKEAIGTPDDIFAPMVLVDTLVGYSWMGFLIALSGFQERLDRWNGSNRKILDELAGKISPHELPHTRKLKLWPSFLVLLVAGACAAGVTFTARFFPEIENVITNFAWVIILISTLGILLSLTPVRYLEKCGSTKIGSFLIYYVITAIGAQASLSKMGNVWILIAVGLFIVIFHGTLLFCVWRKVKAPVFLLAAASQANIGGVVSGPIVAAVYQPGLAPVGLLLAILGNITGTYLGIVVSQICRAVM